MDMVMELTTPMPTATLDTPMVTTVTLVIMVMATIMLFLTTSQQNQHLKSLSNRRCYLNKTVLK